MQYRDGSWDFSMADIWQDIRGLVTNLFDSPTWKSIGVLLLGLVHQLFGKTFTPIHSAVITLVALDWIAGLSYAVMSRQVSSSKSLRGVVKLTIYGVVFVVGAQLDKIQVVGSFLNGSLAGVIVLTEAVSVLENTDKIARYRGIDLPWLEPVIQILRQSGDAKLARQSRGEHL